MRLPVAPVQWLSTLWRLRLGGLPQPLRPPHQHQLQYQRQLQHLLLRCLSGHSSQTRSSLNRKPPLHPAALRRQVPPVRCTARQRQRWVPPAAASASSASALALQCAAPGNALHVLLTSLFVYTGIRRVVTHIRRRCRLYLFALHCRSAGARFPLSPFARGQPRSLLLSQHVHAWCYRLSVFCCTHPPLYPLFACGWLHYRFPPVFYAPPPPSSFILAPRACFRSRGLFIRLVASYVLGARPHPPLCDDDPQEEDTRATLPLDPHLTCACITHALNLDSRQRSFKASKRRR